MCQAFADMRMEGRITRQYQSHSLKPLILQGILSSRDDFTKVLLKKSRNL